VRAQLDALVHDLVAGLGANLIGVYLHGSLALGCFNPQRSDLDLLVVTHTALPATTQRDIAHLLLDASGKPQPLEISILNQADLVPWQYPTPFDFHYSEGWREQTSGDLASGAWHDWTANRRVDPDLGGHVMVVGRRGVCLYGAPIAEVFPPVPPADYLASVLDDVLSAEFGIYGRTAPAAYIVLNACRTLAYLRTGEVLSKDEGGVWALAALPDTLHPAIQAALDAYRTGDDAPLARLDLAPFAATVAPELEAARYNDAKLSV
jgi:streptomycin 3"-adenylyltransferase